jgi:hypothetical protein
MNKQQAHPRMSARIESVRVEKQNSTEARAGRARKSADEITGILVPQCDAILGSLHKGDAPYEGEYDVIEKMIERLDRLTLRVNAITEASRQIRHAS